MKIVPAILEKDFENVKKYIDIYSKVSVSLQVDVCDGEFVENKTWKPNAFEDINGYLLDLEFDMMVKDTRKYIDILLIYDAKKIVVHTRDMNIYEVKDLFEFIKNKNIFLEVGVCDNDIAKIKEIIDHEVCDYLQFMGIEKVGEQGQKFDNKVLNIIKEIKDYIQVKNIKTKENKEDVDKDKKDIYIQVDGGMSEESIRLCQEAGATSFVVGSCLKNSVKTNNLKETFEKLKATS